MQSPRTIYAVDGSAITVRDLLSAAQDYMEFEQKVIELHKVRLTNLLFALIVTLTRHRRLNSTGICLCTSLWVTYKPWQMTSNDIISGIARLRLDEIARTEHLLY